MLSKQYNLNFTLSGIASFNSFDWLWWFIGSLAEGYWFWTRAAIGTLLQVGFSRLDTVMDFLKWSHKNEIATVQLLL
jgi:hypothetical protein